MDRRPTVVGLICCILALNSVACIGVCDMFAPRPWEFAPGYYLLDNEFGISIHTRSGPSTYPYVIKSDVIDFDWDEQFIVVKQDPREHIDEPDTGVVWWYIVEIVGQRTHGPFTYEQYVEKRTELSVTDELELLEPEEEPWEAFERKHGDD
jgi:hypothetical protein